MTRLLRIRIHAAIALCIALLCQSSSAMTLNGYEQLTRKSESRDPKIEPFVSKAILHGHLSGIAEAIQVSQTGSQVFRIGERKVLCFPSNVRITGDLIRGALDAELKQPSYLQERLGTEWRTVPLTFVVATTLQKLFPCPAEVSSPRESHPQALPEPDVNLSIHPAPIVQSS